MISHPSSAGALNDQFKCFAWLWALSAVFQLVALESVVWSVANGTLRGFVEFFMILAAGGVLWSPSARTLVVLMFLQILNAAVIMPTIPNHRLLSGLVGLTFILSFAPSIRASGRSEQDFKMFEDFSRAARVETVLVYFFAAFAKLNTGFLNPETSCGSQFYLRMAKSLPMFPTGQWAAELAIHLTLLFELGIPVLLLARRTRILGVFLGIVFHFFLSLDYMQHTMDFSSLMYALLFLFLPHSFLVQAQKLLSGAGDSARELRYTRLVVLVMLTAVLCAGFMMGQRSLLFFFYGRHIIWYSYAAAVMLIFLAVAFRGLRFERAQLSNYFRPERLGVRFAVALVILNGLCPYLGAKTRSSFDMYSNLRLEEPQPNHLLIPGSLDLFGWQRDRVRVISTNDAKLSRLRKRRSEMLYFEFSSYVLSKPGLRGVFIRNGERLAISNEQERLALEGPSTLTRKLVWFRNVDLHSDARCDW